MVSDVDVSVCGIIERDAKRPLSSEALPIAKHTHSKLVCHVTRRIMVGQRGADGREGPHPAQRLTPPLHTVYEHLIPTISAFKC